MVVISGFYWYEGSFPQECRVQPCDLKCVLVIVVKSIASGQTLMVLRAKEPKHSPTWVLCMDQKTRRKSLARNLPNLWLLLQ